MQSTRRILMQFEKNFTIKLIFKLILVRFLFNNIICTKMTSGKLISNVRLPNVTITSLVSATP